MTNQSNLRRLIAKLFQDTRHESRKRINARKLKSSLPKMKIKTKRKPVMYFILIQVHPILGKRKVLQLSVSPGEMKFLAKIRY